MKLTPEQKAFYEFGAAKAFLFNKIEEARNYARQFYGESYCELTRKERADCWKHSEIKFFIKLVRERRAACRAWNPVGDKTCSNCKHTGTVVGDPCFSCCFPYQGEPNYWEPRKEEQDND